MFKYYFLDYSFISIIIKYVSRISSPSSVIIFTSIIKYFILDEILYILISRSKSLIFISIDKILLFIQHHIIKKYSKIDKYVYRFLFFSNNDIAKGSKGTVGTMRVLIGIGTGFNRDVGIEHLAE